MNRVYVDKVSIDSISIDETVEQISAMVQQKRLRSVHVATPNAQFVQIARKDPHFASILEVADLSVADGVPLVWACRFLGHPIPGRVNGTDLMVRLCEVAALRGHTVYLMGGRPGAAEGAAKNLVQSYPGLKVVGTDCPPMGFMDDPALSAEAAARVDAAAPDFLFVGLGAPKQEYWIQGHLNTSAKAMIGVGGSFELIAGITTRAPLLFQRNGLEWLWRLAVEPGRLWKRYLVGNTLFIALVFRQWFTEKLARLEGKREDRIEGQPR